MEPFNLFPKINGSELHAVFALSSIKSLTEQDIQYLNAVGIERVSDLLCYKPYHDAQLIVIIARGEMGHGFDIGKIITPGNYQVKNLPSQNIDLLKSISPASITHLNNLGIITIKDLAEFRAFKEAEQLIVKATNYFSEHPSAPDELIPKLKGSVHSLARFNSFIKNRTIMAPILKRDTSLADGSDAYVDDIFLWGTSFQNGKQIYQIHFGYIAGYVQKWVFVNTHLGELLYSLPLAPGESRNIAVISWLSKQATKRFEDTKANENLLNQLVHNRALNEVTRATANDHIEGKTDIESGSIGGSLAGTLGWGSTSGAGIKGSGEAAGIPATGAASTSDAKGVGVGGVISGGYQKGTITSSTDGNREVNGSVMQNITEVTNQNASNLRSLWSTIIVEDEQSESKEIQTRNVTNYNHSHALTIQYYEVLHHYRTEMEMKSTTPLLFLPFNPIQFNFSIIQRYWHLFRQFIPSVAQRELFDKLANPKMKGEGMIDSNKTPKIIKIDGTVTLSHPYAARENRMRSFWISQDLEPETVPNRDRISASAPSETDKLLPPLVFDWKFNEAAKDFAITIHRGGNFTVEHEQWSINFTGRISIKDDDGNKKTEFVSQENIPFWGREEKILIKDLLKDKVTSAHLITELEYYFKARKYFFTKILLQSIEVEQLIDIIEELYFPFDGTKVYLTEFIEPEPLAIANNYILFKMKAPVKWKEKEEIDLSKFGHGTIEIERRPIPLSGEISTASSVSSSDLKTMPETAPSGGDNITFIQKKLEDTPYSMGDVMGRYDWLPGASQHLSPGAKAFLKEFIHYVQLVKDIPTGPEKPDAIHDDIFLPSNGVFAEAVLGLSNASEKIDITRFYNWQDSPIPNLAPQIAAVDPNKDKAAPINTGTPTVPGNVLNIVNPAAFPDPTGLALSMAAIQNGNMFRDMSKSSELTTTMANLSGFAQKLAELSSKMAGDSQREALQAATEVAKTVAGMVPNVEGASGSAGSSVGNTPSNPTERGGAVNILKEIEKDPETDKGKINEEKAKVVGSNPPRTNPGEGALEKSKPTTVVPKNNENQETGAQLVDVHCVLRAFVPSEVWTFTTNPMEIEEVNGNKIIRLLDKIMRPLKSDILQEIRNAIGFKGNNRDRQKPKKGFYEDNSMASIEIDFQLDPDTFNITEPPTIRRGFGPTALYWFYQLEPDILNAKWSQKPKAGETPIGSTEMKIEASSSDIDAYVIRPDNEKSEVEILLMIREARPYLPPEFLFRKLSGIPDVEFGGSVGVEISMSGKDVLDALYQQNFPGIDAHIKIKIKKENNVLKYHADIVHDGFPAYELYLNEKEIYHWMPGANDAPNSLDAIGTGLGIGQKTDAKSGELPKG